MLLLRFLERLEIKKNFLIGIFSVVSDGKTEVGQSGMLGTYWNIRCSLFLLDILARGSFTSSDDFHLPLPSQHRSDSGQVLDELLQRNPEANRGHQEVHNKVGLIKQS